MLLTSQLRSLLIKYDEILSLVYIVIALNVISINKKLVCVNFMQILCIIEILTQTYKKQPLSFIIFIWIKFLINGSQISLCIFDKYEKVFAINSRKVIKTWTGSHTFFCQFLVNFTHFPLIWPGFPYFVWNFRNV